LLLSKESKKNFVIEKPSSLGYQSPRVRVGLCVLLLSRVPRAQKSYGKKLTTINWGIRPERRGNRWGRTFVEVG